jgi:uncharacterized membrane-anchored protein YjiN (DUF445 family)
MTDKNSPSQERSLEDELVEAVSDDEGPSLREVIDQITHTKAEAKQLEREYIQLGKMLIPDEDRRDEIMDKIVEVETHLEELKQSQMVRGVIETKKKDREATLIEKGIRECVNYLMGISIQVKNVEEDDYHGLTHVQIKRVANDIKFGLLRKHALDKRRFT